MWPYLNVFLASVIDMLQRNPKGMFLLRMILSSESRLSVSVESE